MHADASALDVVIAWVDGSDPAWRRRRAAAHEGVPASSQTLHADVEGRYRDNGELRFLLLSLRRYLHGVRRTILVTDGQRPSCLWQFPEVEVVDHHEFIAPEFLPTFSSRAIEASLHRIAGLAEHFIYFNDDLCLMRPASLDDFFTADGSVVHVTDMPIPNDSDARPTAEHQGAINARRFMQQHHGRHALDRLVAHAPRGVRRSLLQALERRHPPVFAGVRAERFRSLAGQNPLVNLYPEWCLLQGRGAVRCGECSCLTSGDFERAPLATAARVRGEIHGHQLSLCVNDTGDDRDVTAGMTAYARVMGRIFPSDASRSDSTPPPPAPRAQPAHQAVGESHLLLAHRQTRVGKDPR